MPCLLALVALAFPRILIAILWFFTGWFAGLFTSVVWPILGVVFLPTSLLWYTAVQHWYGGHWGGWQFVGLAVALAIDGSPASGRRRARRE